MSVLLVAAASSGCVSGFGPIGYGATVYTPKACVEKCTEWGMEMTALVALPSSMACVCEAAPGTARTAATRAAVGAAHEQEMQRAAND